MATPLVIESARTRLKTFIFVEMSVSNAEKMAVPQMTEMTIVAARRINWRMLSSS
jgi:hypothetical protein